MRCTCSFQLRYLWHVPICIQPPFEETFRQVELFYPEMSDSIMRRIAWTVIWTVVDHYRPTGSQHGGFGMTPAFVRALFVQSAGLLVWTRACLQPFRVQSATHANAGRKPCSLVFWLNWVSNWKINNMLKAILLLNSRTSEPDGCLNSRAVQDVWHRLLNQYSVVSWITARRLCNDICLCSRSFCPVSAALCFEHGSIRTFRSCSRFKPQPIRALAGSQARWRVWLNWVLNERNFFLIQFIKWRRKHRSFGYRDYFSFS